MPKVVKLRNKTLSSDQSGDARKGVPLFPYDLVVLSRLFDE
jgi:hypothetical protein